MNKIIILFIFFFNIYSGFSQDDSLTTVLINEIVVTTQRDPVAGSLVPFSISVITPKELEILHPRTTPEALMGMNGVFIQKTNHGGGSPFIRGLTGNQTLLLVDGIRLNNSTFRYGPNQYLNTIDPYTIGKIEVARGTGSVQYGTDAIGGALQVFTRDPDYKAESSGPGINLYGKYMTGNMEKTGRGELEMGSGKYAVLAGATFRDFGDLIGGNSTGKQTPSGYDEFAADAKIRLKIKGDIELTAVSQLVRQQHVPVYHKVVLENYQFNEFHPQQHLLSYLRMNINGASKIFSRMRITGAFQNSTEGRSSLKNGSSIRVDEKDKVDTYSFLADFMSVLNERWSATTGVELYHDFVRSTRNESDIGSGHSVEKRGLYPDRSVYGNYSFFTLHHFGFGKWMFDGGLRLNAFRIHIDDENLGAVRVAPEALVFNAAVMYNPGRIHYLYAAFSNGYRAPNIDDLGSLGIVDFRYELPAYSLRPERSDNFELGYKMNMTPFSATLSVYRMDLFQLITRVKRDGEILNGYPVYVKENAGKAYIQGTEAAAGFRASDHLLFTAGLSYTYGQNVTRDEPLRRIPPFNGRLATVFRKGKFSSTAEILFASTQDRLAEGDKSDNRIPAGGTPGWQVFNLYAGYSVSIVKLNAGIQNLFNEDYRTHGSGINGVGRSLWIAASINL